MDRERLNLTDNDGKKESKSDQDSQDTKDSESTDQKHGEQSEVNNPESQATKEEQAEKQVAHWQRKIINGEAKLDEAPAWVADKIKGIQKENESKEKDRIKEVLREEERNKEFRETLKNVRELGLSEEQSKKIEETYEEHVNKKGFDKLEALEYALYKNKINLSKQAFKTSLGLTSGDKPLDLNSKPKKRTKEELYKEVYGE